MSQAHLVPAERLFLSAAEIWSAAPDANTPHLADGATHRSTANFGAPSRIGQFLAERLWKTLEATVVVPPSETGRASSAVLSIPWFSDARRDLTLLLRSSSGGGTLEVWHVDPDRNELRLSSGYFGRWDEFRRITASTRFTKGSGLPGRVWADEQPILIEDLGESKAFLRAEAAQSIGLQFGIGLPVRYASGFGVVVLLSSLASPVARSIDIWRLGVTGEMEHLQGLSTSKNDHERAAALTLAQKLASRAATSYLPQVLPLSSADRAPEPSLEFGCAWPCRDRSGVVHIATLVG